VSNGDQPVSPGPDPPTPLQAGATIRPEGPAVDAPIALRTPRRRWPILAVLCVSLLLVSLDNTILNVALPQIVRSMHATSSQLQWIVDAYAVVFAGLLLVMGSTGDRIGRKWVFEAGLVVFATGSALSAFSGTPDRLIAARALMGVGAAAIMPSTLSILTNVFTAPGDRARAIGIWSGTTGLGVAIGPIVGGWLLAHYWWGSVFLVNVPIAAVGLIATTLLVPNSKNPHTKRPDPLGAGLSIAGLGILLWGIIEAPTRSWTSPVVLAAIGAGVAVLGGFVAWERHCDHPMLELAFFRSRRFSVAMGAMAMVIFALMGALFLLTQYLQFSLGYTPLETGVRVAPIAVVLLVFAPLSTVLVRKFGTKPVVFTGMGTIAVGFGLLSQTTVAGSYLDALPALVCLGVGTGLAFAPCTESVMGSLPPEQAGVGSGTNSAALQIGGAMGVAVLGSLLNTRYQDRLTPLLAHQHVPPAIAHLITGSLGGALAVAQHVGGALGGALAAVARLAFVSGMGLALVVGSVVVSASALVVLALLPNRAERRGAVPRAGTPRASAPAAGDGPAGASPSRADGLASPGTMGPSPLPGMPTARFDEHWSTRWKREPKG
jgi:EmrB/QacA subfamily drug resistance transporter